MRPGTEKKEREDVKVQIVRAKNVGQRAQKKTFGKRKHRGERGACLHQVCEMGKTPEKNGRCNLGEITIKG